MAAKPKPDPLALLRVEQRWCNWNPANKKPNPSLKQAPLSYAEALARDAQHIGVWLGEGLAGIDLDANTDPVLGREILRRARALRAYIERSPSGQGWHILGQYTKPLILGLTKKSTPFNVEAYTGKRYFTVTGRCEADPGDPFSNIDPLLEWLNALRLSHDGTTTAEAMEWKDHHVEGLSALAAVEPDDYHDWVTVGMALHSAGADFDVWDEWSQRSEKYTHNVMRPKWNSFQGEGITLGSLFKLARREGWTQSIDVMAEFDDLTQLESEGPAESAAPSAGGWTVIKGTEFSGEPPPRRWVWQDWLPEGVATALAGPPGIAKSTLSLQLAVHTALGVPFLGQPIAEGPALVVSVEDDREELWRRVQRIAGALMVDVSNLDRLLLVDAMHYDTRLVSFDRNGTETAGPARKELWRLVEEYRPRLTVLDLVTDMWSGNPNASSEVTRFIRYTLHAMAVAAHMSLLAVMHPTRAAMRDGQPLGGAVGWEGAFRSVLTMTRPNGGGSVTLSRAKANYAPMVDQALEWYEGYLRPVEVAEADEHGPAVDAVTSGLGLDGAPMGWCWAGHAEAIVGRRALRAAVTAGVLVSARQRNEQDRHLRAAYALAGDPMA